jgi:hypothetical protein
MERKIVWRYTKYHIGADKELTGSGYATMECVERIIQGAVVKDSLRNVPADTVDARGFYIGPPLDP